MAQDDAGQMTVELCILFPVLVAIAFMVFNALSFLGCCAEFDRVSRNAVRVHASSPGYGQDASASLSLVESDLASSFGSENLQVSVASSRDWTGCERYRMTLSYEPTLFGLRMRSDVFGVHLPTLTHESRFAVDPYKPGMLF